MGLFPRNNQQIDGASPTIGTTTDAAKTSDTSGTAIGFLRGLVKIFSDVWDSANHRVLCSLALNTGTSCLQGAAVNTGDGTTATPAVLQWQGVDYLRFLVRPELFNGATWDRKRGGAALDTGLTAGVDVAHQGLTDNSNGVFASVCGQACYRYRVVSAAATQQQVTIDLRNLHDTLAISSVCSAGTSALTVEVSSDNTNWITLDSIAAAATQIKQYVAATVGATVALSPLAFRYVRVTAGSAGASNTTTLTIGAK